MHDPYRWFKFTLDLQKLDMMRLKDNEVNFKVTYEGHPNFSKTYFMNISGFFTMVEICKKKIALCWAEVV